MINDELDLGSVLAIRHSQQRAALQKSPVPRWNLAADSFAFLATNFAIKLKRKASKEKSAKVAALYPENEVPQPQDFEAFGFTKTNPCCMSVS